ncbi:hypothetical protein M427DRAFT_55495 [Gonapodya prolifera JEL478]|uniref:RRM domain-containing protein n=1 Tax=Gonapodya prolifera (strain JEL478) TaxID=1344416 RepID=A0A139AIA6_GONPJ|nr:hypothetical protein M427DRAFT_55495 [Gonapodya prolifera JEL478]|eukprot:KXS16546.1 hypothetical protein M427DRAFT_55495 [Gonapodya prolifera JEL478]
MNVVKEIQRINAKELDRAIDGGASWHDEYRNSAWVFAGGLDFEFSEGDVICIFSQFGEIVDINLVRDKATGKSRGFCFICYEDQRSTVLAVDNFNGSQLAGRTIRVDHVKDYKPPQKKRKLDKDGNLIEEEQQEEPKPRIAPMGILPGDAEIMAQEGGLDEDSDVDPDDPALKGLDPEDPMYAYMAEKIKKKRRKEKKKQSKLSKKHRASPTAERGASPKSTREAPPEAEREWDRGKPPRSPSPPPRRRNSPERKRDGGTEHRDRGDREPRSNGERYRIDDSYRSRVRDSSPPRREERSGPSRYVEPDSNRTGSGRDLDKDRRRSRSRSRSPREHRSGDARGDRRGDCYSFGKDYSREKSRSRSRERERERSGRRDDARR